MPMARNQSFTAELHFHVEMWDRRDNRVVDVLTMTKDVDVARQAFNVAVAAYPRRIIRVRHWMRTLVEHVPENPQ